jgi:hypothetical protein
MCDFWVTRITDTNGNFISISYKDTPPEEGETHGDPGNENVILPKNHGVIESTRCPGLRLEDVALSGS